MNKEKLIQWLEKEIERRDKALAKENNYDYRQYPSGVLDAYVNILYDIKEGEFDD